MADHLRISGYISLERRGSSMMAGAFRRVTSHESEVLEVQRLTLSTDQR